MSTTLLSPTGKASFWRVLLGSAQRAPLLFLALLATQVVLAAYAFAAGGASPPFAMGMSMLLTIAWLLLLIAIPALWELSKPLAFVLLAAGLSFAAVQALDIEPVSGVATVVIASVALLLVVAFVAQVALVVVPGVMLAAVVYDLTASPLYAGIALAIAVLALIGLLTMVFQYMSFVSAFLWTWVSYGLAHTLAVGLVMDTPAEEMFAGFDPALLASVPRAADWLLGAINTLFDMPLPLKGFALLVSVIFGVMVARARIRHEARRAAPPADAALPVAETPPAPATYATSPLARHANRPRTSTADGRIRDLMSELDGPEYIPDDEDDEPPPESPLRKRLGGG